ncbi:3-dehydroquinate synthase II family protein [Marinactinospora thermotolerans]|uniref:3-dehydroquinate synthase II n=1 Tax=Marinactinospora thermotolerans DSM 45154 TaxID=1122192 RepID=A0A1T4R941_9ACTN|nr:3-dehydroquinate synthase II [Marinactinospora thermotolerans]SKA12437.1 3-dehydroquinate synthase II [Marinactinospora thermotolerans DSM 45154]
MKICWIDIRGLGDIKKAVIEEAVHQRVEAIVTDDPDDLGLLPPSVKRVYHSVGKGIPDGLSNVDLVIVDPVRDGVSVAELREANPGVEFGVHVEIVDAASLDDACQAARTEQVSLLDFRDPTKIPLEIVLAAAHDSGGGIITVAEDVQEAEIIFGVLEHGSDGVMMAPRAVGDVTLLRETASAQVPDVELVELEITEVKHVGMGERACVDTCTYFGKDEGILVGSTSKGMILCVSETHPLPYMPTRPFRVNAGAIHSYTLSRDGRTNYLSELRAGASVMAVNTSGRTRMVTVGRVKIETRPLLSVHAVAPGGQEVNLILQDDWHVRVLGPGDRVLNSTELKPGDKVLGHLPTEDRHVGYPIREYCLEQ